MTSQYETNLWSTHVNIFWLAEPIRCCVHQRTQVFKIEGSVCKCFLPSPPSPRLSFYGSCLSSVFLCSETKRKCLLRRLSATKFDDFKHIVSKREFFMYSCVLWCEFIDLVVFVWLLLCDPCHSPTIIRSKGCTEKQPAVQTLSTRRPFVTQKPIESQIFLTRGKLLSSLHRSKLLKGK